MGYLVDNKLQRMGKETVVFTGSEFTCPSTRQERLWGWGGISAVRIPNLGSG